MKSEFDPDVKIIGSSVAVGGSLSIGNVPGIEVTTSQPVIIWLIDQNGVCSSSVFVVQDGSDSHWDDVGRAPEQWTDGPARAFGALTVVTKDGTVSFDWTRDVVLRHE